MTPQKSPSVPVTSLPTPTAPAYKRVWGWGLQSFKHPTPRVIKRFGRALIGVSGYLGGKEFIQHHSKIAAIITASGAVGWFLSLFFGEEIVAADEPAMPAIPGSPDTVPSDNILDVLVPPPATE